MRTISIRELHLDTGKWVREAAETGAVIVTDRGREVAVLQPVAAMKAGARLPDREAEIRAEPLIPSDSTDIVSVDRDRW